MQKTKNEEKKTADNQRFENMNTARIMSWIYICTYLFPLHLKRMPNWMKDSSRKHTEKETTTTNEIKFKEETPLSRN